MREEYSYMWLQDFLEDYSREAVRSEELAVNYLDICLDYWLQPNPENYLVKVY